MTATVGVARERSGERRVAMVPEVARRLTTLGLAVLVETGAGDRAWHPDAAYADAGVAVVTGTQARGADILLVVGPPHADQIDLLHDGQTLIGLLSPFERPAEVAAWAAAGLTAVSLDLLPRTLSRAQSMDALTSQSNVAGYKSVVRAAAEFGGYFPMLMTAAGTVKPATVLVLGTGVAGLQAIATARRLGADVTGYDIRPTSRDEVTSLGARFLDLPTFDRSETTGDGPGGYARALSADEQATQQRALDQHIGRADIVITTAQVPGRKPPVLVPAEAVAGMRPGSVVVDLAAGPFGGNCELAQPGRTVTVGPGVTVIGAADLASQTPIAASAAYARNLAATVSYLMHDGELRIDLTEEIQAAIVVTHAGSIVAGRVREAIGSVSVGQSGQRAS